MRGSRRRASPIRSALLVVAALLSAVAPGCARWGSSRQPTADSAVIAEQRLSQDPQPHQAAPVPLPNAPAVPDAREPEPSAPAAPPENSSPVTARMYDLVIPRNEPVNAAISVYQTRGARTLADAFDRLRRYRAMMRRIFEGQGLPGDLVNLALVESSANPHATSRANAAGIWQFLPATARRYGMRTSSWVDERRDPEKSTRAAAGYLKHLFAQFDDWPLAIAAYNAGEAAVQRAVKKQRTHDFWRLKLPKETQRFVPAFMAVTVIARDPERYGFSPPADDPHDTETLYVIRPTSIHLIARATRTTVREIRDLNPELVNGATPPTASAYSVRIPRQVAWMSHTVRKGETIAMIAARYEVSEQLLRETNRLVSPAPLQPGDVLLIPLIASQPPA